jgi:hypothetical protein
MNSNKITGLGAASADTDAVDRDTGDSRYQQKVTLDAIPAAAGSLSLNSNKITGLTSATTAADAMSRAAGDARYY